MIYTHNFLKYQYVITYRSRLIILPESNKISHVQFHIFRIKNDLKFRDSNLYNEIQKAIGIITENLLSLM